MTFSPAWLGERRRERGGGEGRGKTVIAQAADKFVQLVCQYSVLKPCFPQWLKVAIERWTWQRPVDERYVGHDAIVPFNHRFSRRVS